MEAAGVTFIVALICLIFWVVRGKADECSPQMNEAPSSVDKISLAYKELEEREIKAKKQQEEIETAKRLEELSSKTKSLNELIKKAIEREKSPNIKELLTSILNNPVVDDFSFEEKAWLFNNGNLRKLSEIEQHEHELKEKYYDEHPDVFDSECKKVNAAACWLPFFLIFFLIIGAGRADEAFLLAPFALIAALFAGLVGMGVGHKINLDRAKEYNIDNNRTAYERKELALTKAGLLFTTVRTLHHAKKNLKEFANVDSWKEMK